MADDYVLPELNRETLIGGAGTEVQRDLPVIDLGGFDAERGRIADELWTAASDVGFFQVVNHGIDQREIDRAFALSEAFFALGTETKAKLPLLAGTNAGWENQTQIRPSTGTPDRKESYQLTRPRMDDLWPSEVDVPGFRDDLLAFEAANWGLAMRILSCFATKLGFDEGFFTERHNPAKPDYQSTLRLLHYLPLPAAPDPSVDGGSSEENVWRAGAHTDFDCLTLLHQREGQAGLQLCPGQDMATGRWTPVEPRAGVITCNIGDMLMRWSDDRLPSTLHRVRVPSDGSATDSRYSIAYFAQADCDAVIDPPGGTHPPITADDYLRQRVAANFAD